MLHKNSFQKFVRPTTQRLSNEPQRRFLNLHEYQAFDLLETYNCPVVTGRVASTAEEAVEAHEAIGADKDVVVKAQVLAGGRGKGRFPFLLGGVHVSTGVEDTQYFAERMLGNPLVTKQTGAAGRICNKVFIVERVYNRREAYISFLLDRKSGKPVCVASSQGGTSIEDVAETTPDLIHSELIHPTDGITDDQCTKIAEAMHFPKRTLPKAQEAIRNLYNLFKKTDMTMLEINPFVETNSGEVLCLDCKMGFDDNAAWRHKDIFDLRDLSQEDPAELEAKEKGYEYIRLDGNIGCMVNGAGLAMATMDVIKLFGGEPANFLDLGGNANAQIVAAAFNSLNRDSQVNVIFVNIFGGIARCDTIALGLIMAVARCAGKQKPIVVRLEGTRMDEAQRLVEESGYKIIWAKDMQDGARKAARIAKIQEMATDLGMGVEFDLGI